MNRSDLFCKIYYGETDEHARELFGIRENNSNPSYLTITDGSLMSEYWIHVDENCKALEKFAEKTTHIIFIGKETNLEKLDHMISQISWKRLRKLDRIDAERTEIPKDTLFQPPIYLCKKIEDMSKFKDLMLSYFFGHTMIWMDHDHVSPKNLELGIVKSLRGKKWFSEQPFSFTSKIESIRTNTSVVIQGEEFICHRPSHKQSRINGTSVLTETSKLFHMTQIDYKILLMPEEDRYIYEPLYDVVLYYAKHRKIVNMENVIKCQLMSRSRVILLVQDDEERKRLSSFKVLDV